MTRTAENVGVCRTCGGTGKIICMNSMFMTDGLRKERCGICSGTGKSSYRHWDNAYVKRQARSRETFPRHPDLLLAKGAGQ